MLNQLDSSTAEKFRQSVSSSSEITNSNGTQKLIKPPYFLRNYRKMQFAEVDIVQLTSDIWQSVLGLTVQVSDSPASFPAAECISCSVEITGAWKGRLTLETSRCFACRAAAIMFKKSAEQITECDLADSLSELTNMLGGNLKSILPSPSRLQLPRMEKPQDHATSITVAQSICEVTLYCEAEIICVVLY